MMACLLLILALIAGAYGGLVFHDATTIFQQIASLVAFVCSTVLLSAAFVVNAVDVNRRRISSEIRDLAKAMERADHAREVGHRLSTMAQQQLR